MGLPNLLVMNVRAPATKVERRASVTRERNPKVANERLLYRILRFWGKNTPRRERMIADVEFVRERIMKIRKNLSNALIKGPKDEIESVIACRAGDEKFVPANTIEDGKLWLILPISITAFVRDILFDTILHLLSEAALKESQLVTLDTELPLHVVKMYTPINPETLALVVRFVLTSAIAVLIPSSTGCVKPPGPKPGNTAVRIGISPRFASWLTTIESAVTPVLVVVPLDGVDGAGADS